MKGKILFNKEKLLLISLNIIIILSVIFLFFVGANIPVKLFISLVIIGILNLLYFYISNQAYIFLLLFFLVFSFLGIFDLTFFKLSLKLIGIRIRIIPLIFLLLFYRIYKIELTVPNKQIGNQEKNFFQEKEFYKRRFKELNTKEIRAKLEQRSFLSKPAIAALEELLNEKN